MYAFQELICKLSDTAFPVGLLSPLPQLLARHQARSGISDLSLRHDRRTGVLNVVKSIVSLGPESSAALTTDKAHLIRNKDVQRSFNPVRGRLLCLQANVSVPDKINI